MKFENLTRTRHEYVDNETDWTWIKSDSGAWDGPKSDWEQSHKIKYMKYLKNNDVVVTAGANQGMYARLYANYFKSVYAFEPDPLNFHCMVMNTQRDNIIKMQAALGSEPGFITVNRLTMENTGMHTVSNGGIIPILTLDSFNFNVLNLLQLDVEGYEIEVIKGGVHTINRLKPVIVLERGRHPDVLSAMMGINYRPVDDSSMDTVFVSC